MSALRWRRATGDVAARVEAWRAGDPATQAANVRCLAENDRRTIHVLDPPASQSGARALVVKRFHTGSGRHALRESWKRWLGRSPAAREFDALRALRAAGVPVPEPLGLATCADGDTLLVSAYIPGRPFLDALAETSEPGARAQCLHGLGEAISALHRAGWRHGDLHPGNLHLGPEGPVILDLQRARRTTTLPSRLAELGALAFGLERHGVAHAERARVVATALGAEQAEHVEHVLSTGADRFAARHGRGRTRRALHPGRRFAAVRIGARRGLRDRGLSEDDLAKLLEAHTATARAGGAGPIKQAGDTCVTEQRVDGRAVIVKEVFRHSLRHALADRLRGSVARRSWVGGHGLRARDLPAPRPLAWLDERRQGLPVRSWIVLERVGETDLGALAPEAFDDAAARRQLAEALARRVGDLHARGATHRDLKAGNLRIATTDAPPRLWLIDLEDVRFGRRPPGRRARVRALVQLNASIGEDVLPAADRLRALALYTERLPLGEAHDALVDRIVAASLARAHVWKGRDCTRTGQSPETVSQRK